MKTKLTLSVSPEAVSQARKLARSRGQSISSLFENWASRTAEKTSSGLAGNLRGRWKHEALAKKSGEARLDYLLEKHAGK